MNTLLLTLALIRPVPWVTPWGCGLSVYPVSGHYVRMSYSQNGNKVVRFWCEWGINKQETNQ